MNSSQTFTELIHICFCTDDNRIHLTSPVVLQASVPRHSVQIGTTCGFYTKVI